MVLPPGSQAGQSSQLPMYGTQKEVRRYFLRVRLRTGMSYLLFNIAPFFPSAWTLRPAGGFAPALSRELPLDLRERNTGFSRVGAFGLSEDARQSAIFQQLGDARKIVF